MTRFFVAIVFAAFAQMSVSDQLAISAYQSALQRGSLENAFDAIARVAEALTRGRGNNPSILESMSEDAFGRLQRDLPGTLINREEVVFVKADPDYFVKLAADRGDDADRQFFAAYKTTYPEGVWPIYIEQQTDYSGCTAFGAGKLVDSYRMWSEFQRAFPNRYVAGVRKELDDVNQAFTSSTCACEDATSVQRELERFIQLFPTSPIRPKVDERLKALKSTTSDIRAHCISG